jgi:hypothetical protein
VIGTSRDRHDLSGLDAPLRSHGGVSGAGAVIANRIAASLPTDAAGTTSTFASRSIYLRRCNAMNR